MAASDHPGFASHTKKAGARSRTGTAYRLSRPGIDEIHAGRAQPGSAVGRQKAAQLAESTSLNTLAPAVALSLAGLIDQHRHPVRAQSLRAHPPVLDHRAAVDYPLPVRH